MTIQQAYDITQYIVADDAEHAGYCADVTVFTAPAHRISELLGPDGEPLMVGYERPKVGFDLREVRATQQR